jgi:hypothetical protein
MCIELCIELWTLLGLDANFLMDQTIFSHYIILIFPRNMMPYKYDSSINLNIKIKIKLK